MNEKSKRTISLVYSILLSAVLTLLAVLLIVGCIRIYSLGDAPFTTENIGREFARVSVLVTVAIIMTLGGGLISLLIGFEHAGRGKRSSELTVATLSRRVSLESPREEVEFATLRERSFRRFFGRISILLYTVGSLVSLFYILDPDNYAGIQDGAFDPNRDVSFAALVIAICLAIPFILSVVMIFLFERSRQREISYLKTIIAMQETKGAPSECRQLNSSVILGVRIAVIGAAVLFITLGIINGGYGDVLGKAVKICQECIGIG